MFTHFLNVSHKYLSNKAHFEQWHLCLFPSALTLCYLLKIENSVGERQVERQQNFGSSLSIQICSEQRIFISSI